MIDRAVLTEMAGEANLAPSVHNTQPARWVLEDASTILLLADLSRQLRVGDPQLRDMGLSCGTALEGMAMALGKRGFLAEVDDVWAKDDRQTWPGYRLAARIRVVAGSSASHLEPWITKRHTWRDAFLPASSDLIKALAHWAEAKPDVTLLTVRPAIEDLARRNDAISLSVLSDRDFRQELVRWMRVSAADPNYDRDGLNLEALHMDRLTGSAAGIILPSALFDILNKLGLGGALAAEAAKTKSATAIALFHRPKDEGSLATGRAFYRFWLEFTQFELAGWPMAAMADVASSADDLKQQYSVPEAHRLINVLRIGKAPRVMRKFRLPRAELLLG